MLSSTLHNRYLLEHVDVRQESPSRIGHFLYRGLNYVNEIERSSREACKILFGAKYVEFRCLSGLHAMQTTIASLTKPGDKVMRVATKDDGGHFLTEQIIKLFGRYSCTYEFDDQNFLLDIDKTEEVIRKESPDLLYIDAMHYLFPFPLKELKETLS